MKIGSINRINMEAERSGSGQMIDSESKEFQNQIASAQNKLKDLAADHKLNDEEKEKKRKEIQQKITELNNQLKQHQTERRREQQEMKDKRNSLEEESVRAEEDETDAMGFSDVGMKAILAASSSINHAKAQGNMAMATESKARVLQTEISQDVRYGKDTAQKQKELKKLEQTAVKIKGAKMSYLSKASREMRMAAEKERNAEKKSDKGKSDYSVNPALVPWHSDTKKKTDIYLWGQMFSNVDFHF